MSTSYTSGRRLWSWYMDQLKRHPLPTKAVTAGLIFGTSDLATQQLVVVVTSDRDRPNEREGTDVDVRRALGGAAFGVVGTAWLHVWWSVLEVRVNRAVPALPPTPRNKLRNALAKVAVDQTLGAPFYIYCYYLLTTATTTTNTTTTTTNTATNANDTESSTKSFRQCHDRAAEMLWPTMTKHWRLWPAVHTINFYFFPLHQRVLVQNLVLVGWSGYLSHLNHNHHHDYSTNTHTDTETLKEEEEEEEKKLTRKETLGSKPKLKSSPVRRRSLQKRETKLIGLDVLEQDVGVTRRRKTMQQ